MGVDSLDLGNISCLNDLLGYCKNDYSKNLAIGRFIPLKEDPPTRGLTRHSRRPVILGNVVSMTRAMATFDRSDSRAMTRDAFAFPGAALILGTLLLLSAP